MKGTILLICLLFLIMSADGLRTRIFNGWEVREGSFKYHVLISAERGSHKYCGGSIIDKRWILTAAHCFRNDNLRKLLVQVGSVMRSGRGGIFYRVENRIPHEAFSEETFENDIALLRVDRDIEYTDEVQAIALANRDTKIGDNEEVKFTGFGLLENFSHSETLQIIFLEMHSYDKCKHAEPQMLQTQICTIPVRGEGPCAGDSGGPLVNEEGLQIGIYSGSYGPALKSCGKLPELYTRVPSYRDWIDSKIRQH